VAEYKSHGPGYTVQVQTRLHTSYGKHYRRALPDLLSVLEFRSNNETHRPSFRRSTPGALRDQQEALLRTGEDVPLAGVVPEDWLPSVLHEDRKGRIRVERINYEICVLRSLRESLRCKEIWVVGADRYRIPIGTSLQISHRNETRTMTCCSCHRTPMRSSKACRTR